jgi:hypothetical protein
MTLERLRYYAYDEREPVLVNETRGAELRIRESLDAVSILAHP